MKYYLFVLILFVPNFLFAKELEKHVKSEIKEVTVFLSGAQVSSVASVSLAAGTTNVVFTDLSQYISDDNNIQVKAEGGDITILSVVRKLNYLNNDKNLPKEIRDLKDTLDALTDRKTLHNNMIKVYDQEEQMLLANKSIGGTNTGVNIAELEKAANLLRNRLMEIQAKRMELQKKVNKMEEQFKVLQLQLNELSAKQNFTTSEITISVSCKSAINAKVWVSYLVNVAGWEPYYDIRAIDSNSPIKLEYKAHVWQNTGYDWENVKLSLSTGNPFQSATQPKLATWWVSPTDPYQRNYSQKAEDKSISQGYGYTNFGLTNELQYSSAPMSSGSFVGDKTASLMAYTTSSYTSVTESQVTTSFDISLPYTVPSDNKPYSVSVQDYNIPATYKYFSVPKLDKDAFLLARITGWEQYNLMSANANIYYEGVYIGASYINTRNTSDTLSISLGRDKNVLVTRVKLQDLSEKKVIGSTKKEIYTFEITVRNNKKQAIEMLLEDQIPVTKNSDVEVELIESSAATFDKEVGKLSWPLKLVPGETKKLKLSYSVKYPKDKVISNL